MKDTTVADYSINDVVSNQIIKYTKDPSLYMTERHADYSFQYSIPVKAEGPYVLITYHSEVSP